MPYILAFGFNNVPPSTKICFKTRIIDLVHKSALGTGLGGKVLFCSCGIN
jgi:hypothetical protein